MLREALERVGRHVAPLGDRAFVQLVFRNPLLRRRSTRESLLEQIDGATTFYPARLAALYPDPVPIVPQEVPVWRLRGGEVVDISWPSRWQALHPSHTSLLSRFPENGTCHARWFRHHEPRPAVVCLHGWGAGHFRIEARAFRADQLYRCGLDVVLATLPFHARRLPARRRAPLFPHPSPIRSVEGFAQAVLDLRELIRHLRTRSPAVGVSGMSLGGYTAALLATIEPGLDFVIPVIPVGSIEDLMWEMSEGTPERRRAESLGITYERFSVAFSPVSVLNRAPRVEPERVMVVPGLLDRVVPPIPHGERLARHFGAKVQPFPGAHLVQVGRDELFDAIERFLRELEVLH